MPQPSSSLATLRPELGSMLEFDLMMNRDRFIWNRVFPVLNVAKQSGTFGKIPVEQLLQSKDTVRAPGSGYGRGNFKFQDVSYACRENGWEEPIDDAEAEMYADFFDAETVATARAAHIVLESAERRIATKVFNTSVWTGSSLFTNVTTEWSTYATADPIDDVLAAKRKVRQNSGLIANALICSLSVFENLRNCTQIIDRIASAGAGSATKPRDITVNLLAQALDLDYLIVGGALKNTANEGQSATITDIWDDEYAMVCRVAETNDIREPCIGRTFHWGADGSQVLGLVETYRDESVRSDIIRVRHQTDELVMYTEAGHLLGNITA